MFIKNGKVIAIGKVTTDNTTLSGTGLPDDPLQVIGGAGERGPKGEQGPQGEKGPQGDKGADATTPTIIPTTNGYEVYIGTELKATLTNGINGTPGTNGTNGDPGIGIERIDKTSTVGLVDTYTITFTDQSNSTFTVTNGSNGNNGKSIENAEIDSNGHLVITIEDSDPVDLGLVKGSDGRSITNIEHEHNPTTNKTDITITYSDSSADTKISIPDGAKGETGKSAYEIAKDNGFKGTEAEWVASLKGVPGPKGDPGKDGTGVTILGSYESIDELEAAHPTGNIGDAYLIKDNLYVWDDENQVWKNVGNIQGPPGTPGTNGKNGSDGASITGVNINNDGNLIVSIDGTDHDLGKVVGDNGNGISSISKTSTEGKTDTYTITFTNGTTQTFNVVNGNDGLPGNDGASITSVSIKPNGHLYVKIDDNDETDVGLVKGADGNGISSISKTSTEGKTDTYTITFTNGTTQTFNVVNGNDGSMGYTPVVSSKEASKTADHKNGGIEVTYIYPSDAKINPITYTIWHGNDADADIAGLSATISNEYAKKSEIPTVPTAVSELENDKGYITTAALTDYATQTWVTDKDYITTAALTDYAKKSEIPTVPTAVSKLENDVGYITNSALEGYAKSSELDKYVTSAGLAADTPYVFMNEKWEPAYNQIVSVYKSGTDTVEGYANKVSYYYHNNTNRTDYNYIAIDNGNKGVLKMWTLPQHWSTMVSGDSYISVSAGNIDKDDWRWIFNLNTTTLDNVYQKQTEMTAYVTSAAVTGTDQYAMTTEGWKPVEGGGGGDYLPLTGGTVDVSTGDGRLRYKMSNNYDATSFVIQRGNNEITFGVSNAGGCVMEAASLNSQLVVNDVGIQYSKTNGGEGSYYAAMSLNESPIKIVTTAELPETTDDNTLYFVLE